MATIRQLQLAASRQDRRLSMAAMRLLAPTVDFFLQPKTRIATGQSHRFGNNRGKSFFVTRKPSADRATHEDAAQRRASGR